MARTVDPKYAAAAAQPAPPGVDIDKVPDVQEPENKQRHAASQKGESAGYTPSEKTLKALHEFKHWDEVKSLYGLDVDALVTAAKEGKIKRGVVEALAYRNGFTPSPLYLYVKFPHQKVIKGFFTVRLYTFQDGDWLLDRHPVKYKVARDDEGNVIKDDKGKVKRQIDYNDLKEGSVVEINGTYLTKEDVDHLRLTGCLGHPLDSKNMNGDTVKAIVTVDPLNHSEFMQTAVSRVEELFNSKPEARVFKDSDSVVYEPTAKQLTGIANGEIMEVTSKEDPEKRAFLYYDVARGGLRKTVSYEWAVKREVSRKEQEDLGRKLAKQYSKSNSQGQGASH